VAAETNKGKTAFLTNLCLDLLKTNPHLSAVYFSLDDNKDMITNRFLGILTGLPINDVQRPQKDNPKQKVENAYEILKGYASKGRLDIRDQGEITHIMPWSGRSSIWPKTTWVVLINGLYNLDVESHTVVSES